MRHKLDFLKTNPQVLVLGLLAFFQLNIVSSAYSTVMSAIRQDLALSYILSGSLMSSYFVGYTLGQLPWGLLADKLGSRKVMMYSLTGCSISMILFGL